MRREKTRIDEKRKDEKRKDEKTKYEKRKHEKRKDETRKDEKRKDEKRQDEQLLSENDSSGAKFCPKVTDPDLKMRPQGTPKVTPGPHRSPRGTQEGAGSAPEGPNLENQRQLLGFD